MPPGLDDRAEDAWESLLALADAAGGTWPRRACWAAQVLSAERAEADTDLSYGIRLLTDIRDLYGGFHISFMPSRELIGRLVQLDGSTMAGPGPDHPRTGRPAAPVRYQAPGEHDGTVRGCRLEDFADGFARYLTPAGGVSEPVKPSETTPDQRVSSDGFRPSDTSNRQTTPKPSDGLRRSEAISDGLTGLDTPQQTAGPGTCRTGRPESRMSCDKAREADRDGGDEDVTGSAATR